jgi:hypothetical protein
MSTSADEGGFAEIIIEMFSPAAAESVDKYKSNSPLLARRPARQFGSPTF